jgi:hypothetical protein
MSVPIAVPGTASGTQRVLRWPIDVSRYDRNPLLDPGERAELAVMTQHLTARNRHGVQRSARILDRLIRPIEDVLALTKAPQWTRYDVVNLLVRQMHQRQSAFWDWSREIWIEVEESTSPQCHTRHQIIAVAYLLGGYTDLHLHSCVYQYAYSLAVKIFGKSPVDTSIERLAAELRAWGYTGTWLTRETPRALASVLLVNGSPYLEDLTAEVLERGRASSMRPYLKRTFLAVSTGLASLGILSAPLGPQRAEGERLGRLDPLTGVSPRGVAGASAGLPPLRCAQRRSGASLGASSTPGDGSTRSTQRSTRRNNGAARWPPSTWLPSIA